MANNKYLKKHQRHSFLSNCRRLFPRIALGLLAVVLIAGIGLGICIVRDPYDFRIVNGVCVGGLELGGMRPLEARRRLNETAERVLQSSDLILEFPEDTLRLSPEGTKLSVKTWSAVWDAFQVGRNDKNTQSTNIGLLPYLKYNSDYIDDTLSSYAAKYDTEYAESQWTLEGDYPELNLDMQNDPAAGQTLVVTMGIPETRLDREDAFQRILAVWDQAFEADETDSYAVKDFQILVTKAVDRPAVKQIHEELTVAPVNDSLDLETFEEVSGSYGYSFDLTAARRQILNAEGGQVLRFPMTLVTPEITGDAVYFRDILGYCETPHTSNENRNHNLALACAAMNGKILQPGEVFSYNETLGERTKERGYLPAGAYSGLKLVQSYGGGICQGSSTIYCAALYADLEIVHRVNHGFAVGYMPHGLDATVSWNGPDFKFRNNTHFPIRIDAEVSEGFVKVTIRGTEERDYYIKMESTASWGDKYIYAKSYKCKYDRVTNELISREMEARSNYMR